MYIIPTLAYWTEKLQIITIHEYQDSILMLVFAGLKHTSVRNNCWIIQYAFTTHARWETVARSEHFEYMLLQNISKIVHFNNTFKLIEIHWLDGFQQILEKIKYILIIIIILT